MRTTIIVGVILAAASGSALAQGVGTPPKPSAKPPVTAKPPVIQLGLDTSLLGAPKIERTTCCRMRLTPQVASRVSSGRP